MLKNFINNIYPKVLQKVLSIFDIPSGPIVGLWSLVFLIGCAYTIWTTKQVTQPIAIIFGTVISAFAGHKIVNVWKGTDASKQDKNLDVQGDDNDDNSDKSSK
jgi:hypothetical protein